MNSANRIVSIVLFTTILISLSSCNNDNKITEDNPEILPGVTLNDHCITGTYKGVVPSDSIGIESTTHSSAGISEPESSAISVDDSIKLEDGLQFVRLYTDPSCYSKEKDGVSAIVGVEAHSDYDYRFYPNDFFDSLSVGDSLRIDDDITIRIRSNSSERDGFIGYGTLKEEFIRVSDHYIFVHPSTGISGYQDIKDYWQCAYLTTRGDYYYLGEYKGKTRVHIASSCEIVISDQDRHLLDYKDTPDTDNEYDKYDHKMTLEEFMSCLDDLREKDVIAFVAGVTIKNREIVSISILADCETLYNDQV